MYLNKKPNKRKTMNSEQYKKCNQCRVNLPLSHFSVKRNDELYKQCKVCRDKDNIYRRTLLCEHGNKKHVCVTCGGVSICEHLKMRRQCRECKGSSFCLHGCSKSVCKICNIEGRLRMNVVHRMYKVLGYSNFDYLGCGIIEFKAHIESQFREGMTWLNYGEWVLDHKRAIGIKGLTEEEIIERLNFTNVQPLWFSENAKKYISEEYTPLKKHSKEL